MNQYMLVARDNQSASSFENPEDRTEFMRKFNAWTEKLISQKLFVRGDQLSKKMKQVCLAGDSVQVIDGPFAETKEAFTGYFLIRAENMNHAAEIAKDCPVLRFDNLEIYEIIEGTHNE